MDKIEAYKILTDEKQKVIDSTYPIVKFNEKWLKAYNTAKKYLKMDIEKGE